MKTVAYLRVSTAQQDVRSQRLAILEHARNQDFPIDDFIEATASGQASEKRRRLDELMSVLQRGDRLVVSELSRLGRSLGQIVAILDALAKSHLVTALGLQACERGYSVLFTSAIDAINTLAAAKAAGQLKRDLRRYLRPRLLILDELGYLPIDKTGADLLFQIISQRYERGSIAITTNRVFKHWPEIFNHDATLTSAVLDRLLHHAETVTVEGNSFRIKDVIDN